MLEVARSKEIRGLTNKEGENGNRINTRIAKYENVMMGTRKKEKEKRKRGARSVEETRRQSREERSQGGKNKTYSGCVSPTTSS